MAIGGDWGDKSKDMKNLCFSVMFILIVEMQTVSDIFYVNLWMDMRDWWEEAGVLVRSWNLKVDSSVRSIFPLK